MAAFLIMGSVAPQPKIFEKLKKPKVFFPYFILGGVFGIEIRNKK